MKRNAKKISIVQFSEHALSRLRVTPSPSGVAVDSHAYVQGDWPRQDGSLEEALRAFALEHRIKNDRVYSVLPRHDVTTRILNLPSQDAEEIRGMLRLGASEYVPYPAEELVVAHAILEKLPDGSAKTLAVIAHQDAVQDHFDLLKAAGIEPHRILLSTACLLSAALSSKSAPDACTAYVELKASGLEVLVTREGILEYGRGVSVAQPWNFDEEHREASLAEIAGELQRSLSAHRRDSADGHGAQSVFLTSEAFDSAALAPDLGKRLELPCNAANGELDVVHSGREALRGVPLAGIGAALTAQGRGKCQIELMPDTVVRRRSAATAQKRSLRLAALVALVLFSGGALYAQAALQRSAYIRDLEVRIESIRPRVKNVMAKRKHLERLQRQVERRGTPLELLSSLSALSPNSGLNLTRFSFQHDEGIELRGRAKQRTSVHALAEALRESPIPQFARAREIYTDYATERRKEVWNFGISIAFDDEEADS